MDVSSTRKALNNFIILDEIIWLSHAGGCPASGCQPPVIFSYRPPDDHHYKVHFRTLLSCILVCKTWAPIAIPQLWGAYTSDWNLLSIIADVPHWQYARFHIRFDWSRSVSPECKIRRDPFLIYDFRYHQPPPPSILPSRLDRWQYYTQFIRKLGIHGLGSHQFSEAPTFTLEVSGIVGHQPLVPSLRKLACSGGWLEHPSAPAILVAILSPAITQIELKFERSATSLSTDRFNEIMDTVARCAPKFTKFLLFVEMDWRDQEIEEEIDRIIRNVLPKMISLQTLILESSRVNAELLVSIAKALPHLCVFESIDDISIAGRYDFPVSRESRHRDMTQRFPGLESIRFVVTETRRPVFADMLRSFGYDHPLQNLSMQFRYPTRDQGTHQDCMAGICAVIAQVFPALHTFHIHLDYGCDIPPLRFMDLQALTRCGDLTEVKIETVKIVSNQELAYLLAAWPNLTSLTLLGPDLRCAWMEFESHIVGWAPDVVNIVGTGIAEDKWLMNAKREGLDLESLTLIRDSLPHLEKLKLSLICHASTHLRRDILPFPNLHLMDLRNSFQNFRFPDFNKQEAARYIASFLNPRTQFRLPVDPPATFRVVYANISFREDWVSYWYNYFLEYRHFDELVGALRNDSCTPGL